MKIKSLFSLETILAGVLAGGGIFLFRECDKLSKTNASSQIVVERTDDFYLTNLKFPDYDFDQYEFYRRTARNLIGQLSRKHKIWPSEVVVTDEPREAYYTPGKMKVSISLDLFTEAKLNDWYFAAIHEFGHHKYAIKADKDEFTRLFYEANIAKITGTFKEGVFDIIPDNFGHPRDEATELYASAFVISECGLIEEYKRKFFPLFSKEHKQLAEEIFEVVGK